MSEQTLANKISQLEEQIAELQKAYKEVYNSEVVYNTKDTYGYSQAVEARGGTTLYLSGMTPWNKSLEVPVDTLVGQLGHALGNLQKLLSSKNLTFQHLVSLRFYVAKPDYYEEATNFMTTVRQYFEGEVCAITLLGVTGLAQPDQLMEIEAVAVY